MRLSLMPSFSGRLREESRVESTWEEHTPLALEKEEEEEEAFKCQDSKFRLPPSISPDFPYEGEWRRRPSRTEPIAYAQGCQPLGTKKMSHPQWKKMPQMGFLLHKDV